MLSPCLVSHVLAARVLSADKGEPLRRSTMSLCGVSVGMSIVCLGVAVLDQYGALVDARTHESVAKPSQSVYISDAAIAASKDVIGSPGIGLLAKQFVRKNSQKRIEDEYTFAAGAPLGAGAFGVVRRAVHNRTGIERAVKVINKEGFADHAMLRQEVEALRLMDHPNVCRLVEYFESDNCFWLVMELCRGRELCERVLDSPKGVPEAEAASHMFQMLSAISHCHGKRLVHRDLKPENFIFGSEGARETLKLIDFGYSADPELGGAGDARSSGGTLMYQSPQTLQGQAPTRSDDVWSLGVIFHILLTGRFPFSTNDDHFFQELVDEGRLGEDVQEQLSLMLASPEASDLARKLLAFEPADRITAESALRHPFLGRLRRLEEPLDAQEVCGRCAQFLTSCRLRRIAMVTLTELLDESQEDRVRARATFLALDRTEGIGYSAFVAAMLDGREATCSRALCRVVFDLMDADHDGAISAQDLQARLGLPRADCALALQEAWRDVGDATPPALRGMGFDAFARLMRRGPRGRSSGSERSEQSAAEPSALPALGLPRDPSIKAAHPHVFRHDGSIGRAYSSTA